MKYTIFLDDERDPPIDMQNVIIARNYDSFIALLEVNDFPSHISFDYDLGSEFTGYDCAKAFIEMWIDAYLYDVTDFPTYDIHSSIRNTKDNNDGMLNIDTLLQSFINFCKEMNKE